MALVAKPHHFFDRKLDFLSSSRPVGFILDPALLKADLLTEVADLPTQVSGKRRIFI